MKKMILVALLSNVVLSGCSSVQDTHEAYCNQLKHQIITNSVTTANQSSVTSQDAQYLKANQTYNQMGC